MLLNLIIDGNYILSKLVYTLNKNNILYGALLPSLERSVDNYKKWYPFSKIYIVSDSREKSWRKAYMDSYKATRKKDSDIDWKFVYDTYDKFKLERSYIKVCESPGIEGDDWISFLCLKNNEKGQSNLIVTNDHDIKQLMKMSIDPLWMNFISNEMWNKKSVFLPKNHNLFIDAIRNKPNDDIFSLNNDQDFLRLYENLYKSHTVSEIDPLKTIFIKLVAGDSSDNISSVFSVKTKDGKYRGIGEKGAEVIFNRYLEEFGQIDLNDPDIFENIADLICEIKKVSSRNISTIKEKLISNRNLVILDHNIYPDKVRNQIIERWQLI